VEKLKLDRALLRLPQVVVVHESPPPRPRSRRQDRAA
jgi:hypothetical protein